MKLYGKPLAKLAMATSHPMLINQHLNRLLKTLINTFRRV